VALVIDQITAQVITDAEPAAGAASASAEIDLGDNALVQSIIVYTAVGADGWAAAPAGNKKLTVSILPRQATSGGNYANEPAMSISHTVDTDGAYLFADVFNPGALPRYFVITVLNDTNQNMATDALDVWIEYVKVTS